jgi:hypothetical protein
LSLGLFGTWGLLLIFSLVFITIYTNTQGINIEPEDIGWLLETIAWPIAIIIAVLIFIYEQGYENDRRRKDENDKIIRSCDSILRELQDIETALKDPKYPLIDYPQFGGAKFTDVYLGTNAFRSISQSGLFSYFDLETQNQLSKLYTRIDLFNKESDYLFKFIDQFQLSSGQNTEYYRLRLKILGEYIGLLENEIKELLPLIKTLIQEQKPMTQ